MKTVGDNFELGRQIWILSHPGQHVILFEFLRKVGKFNESSNWTPVKKIELRILGQWLAGQEPYKIVTATSLAVLITYGMPCWTALISMGLICSSELKSAE